MKGTARKKILAAVLCAALSWQGSVWAADETITTSAATGTNDNTHTHTITLSGTNVADALSGTTGTAGAFTIKNSVISGITFDTDGAITSIAFNSGELSGVAKINGIGYNGNAIGDATNGYVGSINNSITFDANGNVTKIQFAGSQQTGLNATAYGNNAKATASAAIAIGSGSYTEDSPGTVASGDMSIAIGLYASATNHYAVAIGTSAKASNQYSTALGMGAQAEDKAATAIGSSANATAQYATAIGASAYARQENSVAIGSNSYVTAANTVSFGNLDSLLETAPKYRNLEGIKDVYVSGGINFTEGGVGTSAALAQGELQGVTKINGITLTQNTNSNTSSYGQIVFNSTNGAVTSINGIALMQTATTKTFSGITFNSNGDITNIQFAKNGSSNEAISIGSGATADTAQGNTIAIGQNANAGANSATALGFNAQAKNVNDTAVGSNAYTENANATAIGYSARATDTSSTALGNSANATASASTALGSEAKAESVSSVALGDKAKVLGKNAASSIALGNGAEVSGEASYAAAIGSSAKAKAHYAIAIGYNAEASGSNATALGNSAQATAPEAIALGDNARAEQQNSVAIGSNSSVTAQNTVSFGKVTNYGSQYRSLEGIEDMYVNGGIIFTADGATTNAALDRGELLGVTKINGVALTQDTQAQTSSYGQIVFDTNGNVTKINSVGYNGNAIGTEGALVSNINGEDSIVFDETTGAVSTINGTEFSQLVTKDDLGSIEFDTTNKNGYVTSINESVNFDSTSGKVTDINDSVKFDKDSGAVTEINGIAYSQDTTNNTSSIGGVTFDITEDGNGYVKNINGESIIFDSESGAVTSINGTAFSKVQGVVNKITLADGENPYITGINGSSLSFSSADGSVTKINGVALSQTESSSSYGKIEFDSDGNVTSINGTDFSALKNANVDFSEIEGNIGALQTSVNSITSDITTIESSVTTINSNINTIQGDITSIQTDLTDLQNTVSNLNLTVDGKDINPNSVTVGTTENGGTQTVIDNTGATFTDAAGNSTKITATEVTTTTVNAADVKATTVTTGHTTVNNDGVSIADKTVITDSDVVINKGTEQEVSLSGVGGRMDAAENRIGHLENRVERLGDEIDEVGALGAALAGLHPIDTNSRTDIAVALGSYDGSQAVALGAFYRPDKRTMLSVGASATDSRQMFNMGVSFALDRLPEKPAADSEVLAAVMARLEKLEAENAQLRAQYEELKTQQQQQQTAE